MIVPQLKKSLQEYRQATRPVFLRNVLKEVLQDYVLRFIYNDSRYKNLIFTGGTCLRKLYGLPRLSEDLDFDYENRFKLIRFVDRVNRYFTQDLQYKGLETKISSNKRTVYLKFPVLRELGLAKTRADSPILFLRCDFAPEGLGNFRTKVDQISTREFTFFVRSYDLPTLFANKLIAFLRRDFFKGQGQQVAFKGRDVFDIAWFLEQAALGNVTLQPNWERVFAGLGIENKQDVWERVLIKLDKISPAALRKDLAPFIESTQTTQNFSENYLEVIKNRIDRLGE